MNILFGRFSYQDTLVLIVSLVLLTVSLWIAPIVYTIISIFLGVIGLMRLRGNFLDWVRLCVLAISGSILVGGTSLWLVAKASYKHQVNEFLSGFIPIFFLGMFLLLILGISSTKLSKGV